MAKFKPFKITESQLDSLPITEGQLILTTDTKKLYFDTTAIDRILLSPKTVTNLSISGTTITYTHLDGTTKTLTVPDTNTTYSAATTSKDGLMSASDKTKIDGIEAGAQKNTVTGVKGSSESSYRTGNINITKANIGLGNVDNTADANKNVAYAAEAGNAATVGGFTVGINVPANAKFTDNNTTYTFATGDANGQIKVTPSGASAQNIAVKGLGSLAYKSSLTASDVGAIAATLKGAVNGVAELDASGKVPTAQLPGYVDDVVEGYLSSGKFYKESAHTTVITGETGKLYVDLSTNKTYRWSGSAYAEISASLALGETSSTAYRGDRGKIAYDHSQVTSGNPHDVTADDIGLGEVENKSSATIRGEITSENVIDALGFTPMQFVQVTSW